MKEELTGNNQMLDSLAFILPPSSFSSTRVAGLVVFVTLLSVLVSCANAAPNERTVTATRAAMVLFMVASGFPCFPWAGAGLPAIAQSQFAEFQRFISSIRIEDILASHEKSYGCLNVQEGSASEGATRKGLRD